MLVATGYFDSSGSPCLKFFVQGVHDKKAEFEAVIDTGFTGFLSMPLVRAFPLGLPLYGTSSSTLADGSSCASITAQARVTMGNRSEKIGIVSLHNGSSEVLIGMDFLRTFDVALFMTSEHIIFVDETEFKAKVPTPTIDQSDEQKPASPQDPNGE